MEFTDVIILIIGIKLIGIGFLVKAAPEMIAGYNTMPAEKKKNTDVKGLSSFMRNGLIIINYKDSTLTEMTYHSLMEHS